MPIPQACDHQLHIPADPFENKDSLLQLMTLGFEIGNLCGNNIGWQHLRIPHGWSYQYETNEIRISDARHRCRVTIHRYENGEIATTLTVHTFFTIRSELHQSGKGWITECDVTDAYGNTYYRTFGYTLRRRRLHDYLMTAAMTAVNIFKQQWPRVSDPLAYWDD